MNHKKDAEIPTTDFRHLVCRLNTFVSALKVNLYTIDQVNLATAKIDDFVILNILMTTKMANFGLSGK